MQPRRQFRWTTRIHVVQTFRDGITLLPFEVLGYRLGVQFASRNAEFTGSGFGQAEKIVGQRDRSFHTFSVTRVMLATLRIFEAVKIVAFTCVLVFLCDRNANGSEKLPVLFGTQRD